MSFEIYGFDLLSVNAAYLFSIILLTVVLYSYIVYLYRSQASGVDYEKYGRLAINDDLDDDPIESVEGNTTKGGKNGLVK